MSSSNQPPTQPQQPQHHHHHWPPSPLSSSSMPSLSIASCREESIMISSSGDVIVCRCRNSSYPLMNAVNHRNGNGRIRRDPNDRTTSSSSAANATRCGWNGYAWMANELTLVCCDADVDDVSCYGGRTATQQQQQVTSGLCSPWISSKRGRSSMIRPVGLLGGAPADVASPLHHPNAGAASSSSFFGRGRHHPVARNQSRHRPPPLSSSVGSPTPPPPHDHHHPRRHPLTLETTDTMHHQPNGIVPDDDPVSPSTSRRSNDDQSPPSLIRIDTNNNNDPTDHIYPVQSFDHTLFYEDAASIDSFVTEIGPPTHQPRSKHKNRENTMSHSTLRHRAQEAMAIKATSSARAIASTMMSSSSSTTRYQGGPDFVHGVPTFLNLFSTVRITKVSAHPLGSHVLLISNAGLLFAYGLNDYGQLGIGYRSYKGDCRYVMTPTIVTPIIEYGGKAIACAAGVNHSLVVVETEEQRLIKKSQSFEQQKKQQQQHRTNCNANDATPLARVHSETSTNTNESSSSSTTTTTETIYHHQVYGFGRNNHLKIGLISPRMAKVISDPANNHAGATNGASIASNSGKKNHHHTMPSEVEEDEMEVVVLPRRVSLRCTTAHASSSYPIDSNDNASSSSCSGYGIFAIEASVDHSAAIVRRSSGDIELYTWGDATNFALGIPTSTTLSPPPPPPPPSSNTTTTSPQLQSKSVMPPLSAATPSSSSQQQHRPSIRVVPVPSFVSCLSRTTTTTTSSTEAKSSTSKLLHHDHGEYPLRVALGPKCTFVVTSMGRCFSFGRSRHGMLGHGKDVIEVRNPTEIMISSSTSSSQNHEVITHVSAGSSHVVATTQSGQVYGWGVKQHIGLSDSSCDDDHNNITLCHDIPVEQQAAVSDQVAEATTIMKTSASEVPTETATKQNIIDDTNIIAWTPIPLDVTEESCIAATKENRSNNYFPQHHGEETSMLHHHTKHSADTKKQQATAIVIQAQAGYDCTYFVTELGKVYSCGMKSGRLGQGDHVNNPNHNIPNPNATEINHHGSTNHDAVDNIDDKVYVSQPKPLFGGLHLFWKKQKQSLIHIARGSSNNSNNNNSNNTRTIGGGIPRSTSSNNVISQLTGSGNNNNHNNNNRNESLLQRRPIFQKSASIR